MKIRDLEKVLKALANERRLRIVGFLLKNKKADVTEISENINLSFRSTSKHLYLLKQSDIVEIEHKSLHSYYSLIVNNQPDNENLYSEVKKMIVVK